MALYRGRIGVLRGGPNTDLNFQFNPSEVRRQRRAVYADNRAAFADFPNTSPNSIAAFEWQRNEAEEIDFELIFHRVEKNKNCDADLKGLDDLMAPDPNTGRPRDLVLVLGKRSDRVRIVDKTVVEKLQDEAGAVQSARVNLRLRALKSRTA